MDPVKYVNYHENSIITTEVHRLINKEHVNLSNLYYYAS